MKLRLYITGIIIFCSLFAKAQQSDSVIDKIAQFPNRLFSKIKSKTDNLDAALTKKTEKYLEKLARKERKLEKKLAKKDSAAAKNLFTGSQERYDYFEQKIKEANNKSRSLSGEYLPYVDSLKASLSFLQQNNKLLNANPEFQSKITGSVAGFNQLQSKLQLSEQIQQFIQQRKQVLRNTFNNYVNKLGAQKYLDDYNKQVYYYSAQVHEYKELLNDPDKLEKKALSLLNKLPAFQDFMKKNSMLASLLNIPGATSPAGTVGQGLPSREQVMSVIQGQVGMASPNPSSMIQQNITSAEGQLDVLRDKLKSFGGGGADLDIPGFVPNNQKTKSFLKRLEFGTNLQTAHSTYYFPVTTDIGLSLGYRLNNSATAGIGTSYKMGWGTGINHIKLSSQGIGLRSYLDMKIKGNLYISGGYEENYQKPFSDFQQIKSFSAWQASGLVGLSKMVSFSAKFIKKTKLQVLWDFLSYYQTPRTQPIKFRVGYNF